MIGDVRDGGPAVRREHRHEKYGTGSRIGSPRRAEPHFQLCGAVAPDTSTMGDFTTACCKRDRRRAVLGHRATKQMAARAPPVRQRSRMGRLKINLHWSEGPDVTRQLVRRPAGPWFAGKISARPLHAWGGTWPGLCYGSGGESSSPVVRASFAGLPLRRL